MAEPKYTDNGGTLREESVTTLVHTVGAAAESRLPLEVTLAVLAEEKDDPRLADVAQRLAAQLQRGVPLDQAIAEVDRDLPVEVRGLMRAGVDSGDLAGTFERFAQQRMASQRNARQIRTAMAYPLMIFAILVPLLLFLSLYVIPIFADLFESFELTLPHITELIIQVSQQVPMLLVGLVLIVVIVPTLLRIIGGRWLFHRVRASIPLLGKLWMWSGQREFAAVLASFLDLRLPMTEAINHTRDMIGDRNVARACRRLTRRLEDGESLSSSLNESMHFDRSLTSLAGWGEANGVLPEALLIAADVFEDRTEQHAALVRRLLPPITLITVAVVMVFIVAGLMYPLFTLLEGLV